MRVDSGGDPGGNETRRVTIVTSGFSATLENDPQVRGQPHAVHHRAHRNGRSLCVNVSPSALPDGGQCRMFSAEVSPVEGDETHFKTALLSRKHGLNRISIAQ